MGTIAAAARPAAVPVCLLLVLAGCVSDRAALEKKLMTAAPTPDEKTLAARHYRVCCPDVLAVRVINRPDLHWQAAVDVDGTYPVAQLGRPRVEGRTPEEIAAVVAKRLGISEPNIIVEVAEYRSKRIYLFGEVKGAPQAVTYRGPETVVELLQRVGGITAGAEPTKVFVVRPNVLGGKRPEYYHVDLHAILLKGDPATNVRLLPSDQVHVGETPQALVERCIPPWMRPFHWVIWDTRPNDRPPLESVKKRLDAVRQERGMDGPR